MNPVTPRPVDVFAFICGLLFFTAVVMFLAAWLETAWNRYLLWRYRKRWEND